jgi:predicted RNase H-like nuclease (RuvC/YqgF family)
MDFEKELSELDKELIKELQCAESDLPASAYAWVEDKEKKTTWHLPIRGKDGKIKCNCVAAALQAIGGARTGKPMNVPESVVSLLKAHEKTCQAGRNQSEPDNLQSKSELAEAKTMDNKELEGKLAEAIKTIGELREASAKKDAEIAELNKGSESANKQLEENKKELADLKNRIEKIEKTPAPATQVVLEKELEMPSLIVQVNKKTGEVYRR